MFVSETETTSVEITFDFRVGSGARRKGGQPLTFQDMANMTEHLAERGTPLNALIVNSGGGIYTVRYQS